ncbi:MAG: tRNA lysidine(34) synthetase TilS [Tepidisphaeraceae bacterium]
MQALMAAISIVPPGRWAVAVSGGADSVALLRAMATRPDCQLVVAHLDHQLRGEESAADANFVQDLANKLGLPCETGLRADWPSSPPPLEGGGGGRGSPRRCGIDAAKIAADPSPQPSPSRGKGARGNASARYRASRYLFFADVVRRHDCQGVLLAHHADDQAETVLLRLARGRSLAGLGGMAAVATMNGLVIRRPLLGVRRSELREYLVSLNQPWREDSSNTTLKYRRNVIRRWLADVDAAPVPSPVYSRERVRVRVCFLSAEEYGPHPNPLPAIPGEGTSLVPALLRLAAAAQRWRAKLDAQSPQLAAAFDCRQLRGIALPFAEHAARRWLVAHGAPPDRVSPADCRHLVEQVTDVAKPSRRHYPGGLLVRRRAGRVDVIPSPPLQSPVTHGQETT